MQVAIKSILLLTLFGSASFAQQSIPGFQIIEPGSIKNSTVPAESRYYMSKNQTESFAPTIVRQSVLEIVDDLPQSYFPVPVPVIRGKFTNEMPTTDSLTSPVKAESSSLMLNLASNAITAEFNPRSIQPNSQSDYAAVQYAADIVPSGIAPIAPTFIPQPVAGNYGAPKTFPMEIRNRDFFGVDRNSLCDEWSGFSRCGGLKANPGHLGLPWLIGDDPCECGDYHHLKNFAQQKRTQRAGCRGDCPSSQCSCESCDSVKTSRGILGNVKRSKCSTGNCGE